MSGDEKSPEEISRDIEQTQTRLGEAVEALAHKKIQLKDEVKEAIVEKATEVRDVVVAKVKEKLSNGARPQARE
jgi:hypothetical protein